MIEVEKDQGGKTFNIDADETEGQLLVVRKKEMVTSVIPVVRLIR